MERAQPESVICEAAVAKEGPILKVTRAEAYIAKAAAHLVPAARESLSVEIPLAAHRRPAARAHALHRRPVSLPEERSRRPGRRGRAGEGARAEKTFDDDDAAQSGKKGKE